MTKYNAILLEKYEPKPTKSGYIRYAGKFLIAINNNTDMKEIIASQLFKPINAEPHYEIILDITINKSGSNTYYNICPKSSYMFAPFPEIKREVHYYMHLDSNGYDPISGKYFNEHPYEHVEIYRISYYSHGYELSKTDYKIQSLDPIDYKKIYNDNLVLENAQVFTEVDYRRLIEALRDYLPIEEHPNKHHYSAHKILQQYREVINLRGFETPNLFHYESDGGHCICGHEIHEICYCEYVSYMGANGISKPPLGAIGNCCIKKMAYKSGMYTRLLDDIVNNFANNKFNLECDISKKNGFRDIQMEFLQKCVLTPAEFNLLQETLKSRSKDALRNNMCRVLYHITKFYEANHDKVFNQDSDEEDKI